MRLLGRPTDVLDDAWRSLAPSTEDLLPIRGTRGSPGVARDTLWATGGLVAMALTGFLGNLVVARSLPPAEVGVFFIAISAVAIAALVSRLGLDYLIVRRIAEARARGRLGSIRWSLRFCLDATAVTGSVLATLGLCLWSEWLARAVFGRDLSLMIGVLVGAWVVSDAVRVVASEAFRGFGDIRAATTSGNALEATIFLAVVAIAHFLHRLTLTSAIGLALVASVLTLVRAAAGLALVVRKLPPAEPGQARSILFESVPIMASALVALLLTQGGVIVAGVATGERGAALYGAGMRIALFLEAPLFIMNAVLQPLIVRLYARGDRRELQHLLQRAAAAAAVPVIVAVAFIMSFGRVLLVSLYGPFFGRAAPIVAILALGQLASVLAGSCGMTLIMTGHGRVAMYVSAGSATVALLAQFALASRFGVNGVAIGATIAVILQNVAMVLIVRRRVGVSTFARFSYLLPAR